MRPIRQAELAPVSGNAMQAVINTRREPLVMFQTPCRSHLFDSQQQMYRLQDDVVWEPHRATYPAHACMLACKQEHDLQRLLLAP